jgi:hypothetical protein
MALRALTTATTVKHSHRGHLFATGQPSVGTSGKLSKGIGTAFISCDIDDVVQ